ncbi:7TM GPCR protein [Aphelenchoides avenae]|nr:7TM GPCR protein [Aphelenchus avenae]
MAALDLRVVHHCLDTFINGFAVVLNTFLLNLILNHSTCYIKVYKHVLLTTCLSDLLLSLVTLLGQPVGILGHGYYVMFSNGFFAYGSSIVDFLACFGLCAGLHANIVFLVVQFWYRYCYVCTRRTGVKSSNIVLFFLPSIWCLAQAAVTAWLYSVPDGFQAASLAILDESQWPFVADRPPHPVGFYWSECKFFIYTGFYAISAGGGYALIVWCEWKILAHLRSLGESIHAATRRMHTEVHRALIALAVGPFVTAILPIAYFLVAIATQSSPGLATAFATSAATTITLLNPITTIYFIRPYRKQTLKVLGAGKQSSSVGPATSVAGLSMATNVPVSK